jgi:hypothetical protein
LIASRAAISLPCVARDEHGRRGEPSRRAAARISACGPTRKPAASASSTTYTLCAPYLASVTWARSAPGPMKTAEGSPRRRAMVSSSRSSCGGAVGVVDEDENFSHVGVSLSGRRPGQMNLRAARNSASLVPPSPSSVTICPGRAADAWRTRSTVVHAASRPTGGVDAEVGQRPGLDRLLLGRHDPLERGVARLVDLVGHRDQRRQARLDRLGSRCRRRGGWSPCRPTVSSEAKVTWGRPRRSASIAGTTPMCRRSRPCR